MIENYRKKNGPVFATNPFYPDVLKRFILPFPHTLLSWNLHG